MRRSRLLVSGLAVLAIALHAPPADAQHDAHDAPDARSTSSVASDSLVADFTRRARAGAARYADQAVAVADGYRALGPDFPAMGEHWANPELVAKGVFDPARPPLLTYIRVGGVPRLSGVVFALPLADGETPPASPFPAALWHDHFGSIEDESLLLNHDAQHAPAGELRLAVLHAWLFVDNPAGTFVTDNWALPYARMGVPVPAAPPADAARALALMGGSLGYYQALAERTTAADASESERRRAILEHHRAAIAVEWAGRAAGTALSAGELSRYAELWRAAWGEAVRR